MTVLKGEVAVKQSIALIKTFKLLKDYTLNNAGFVPLNELLKLNNQTNENTNAIVKLEDKINEHEKQLQIVMENFVDPIKYKPLIIKKNQRIEADVAYQEIYSLAKKSIFIIDDYISVKTLEHLKNCGEKVEIIIFSDNVARNGVTEKELSDFLLDTKIDLVIKPNNHMFHDRYIVIDYKTDNEIIYLCGSSSKDSGNSLTTIMEIEHTNLYRPLIDELLKK